MADGMIVQKSLQQIAEQTAKQSAERLATPSVEDVGRFNEAMQNTAQELPAMLSHSSMPFEPMAVEPVSNATLGDSILRGISSASREYQAAQTDLMQKLVPAEGGGQMDTQAMLRVQLDMMNLTLTQSMASQIASKSSQGLQQLFRNS